MVKYPSSPHIGPGRPNFESCSCCLRLFSWRLIVDDEFDLVIFFATAPTAPNATPAMLYKLELLFTCGFISLTCGASRPVPRRTRNDPVDGIGDEIDETSKPSI